MISVLDPIANSGLAVSTAATTISLTRRREPIELIRHVLSLIRHVLSLSPAGEGRQPRSSIGGPLGADRSRAHRRSAAAVRWAAATVFLVFGVGKFTHHASELASFRQYALPAPDAFVYLIGMLEIVGGLLLAIGLLVRRAALVLAADMIGAIVVSGLGRWEQVSLTLAPLLLVAMCYLVLVGAGSWSLDSRLATSRTAAGPRTTR